MKQGIMGRVWIMAGAMAMWAGAVQAREWCVLPGTPDGDGAGTWASPVSLQTATEWAAATDEIWVAAGTYTPTSYNWRGGGDPADPRLKHFAFKSTLAVYGGFAGGELTRDERDPVANVTILDGDLGADGLAYHVIQHWHTDPGNAVIDGFTIRNGSATNASPGWDQNGGAVLVIEGSPTFRNCIFEDNESSALGGACYADNAASMTFVNCIFRNNASNNIGGGAIGIVNGGALTVSGCLLHDNVAAGWGGGIRNGGSTATIANCTVVNNTSDWGTGAIDTGSGTTTLVNCIVRGNMMGEMSIQITPVATPVTYRNVEDGFTGTGNIDADPAFADAATDDYRLTAGSTSVDAGSNAGVPGALTVDLAGNPRIADGNGDSTATVDMGAYELPAPASATLTMAVSPAGTTTPAVGPHVVGVGVAVPITATPAGVQVFVNWTVTAGDATLGNANLANTTVTLNDDLGATVQANFADAPPETATLTMAVSPGGSGTTVPAIGPHTVNVGAAQNITATPAVGFAFANWTVTAGSATLGNANAADTTVTVNGVGGATVQANFAAETTLTMAINDALGGAIGPAVGAHTVAVGAAVPLTATANPSYRFINWTVTAGNATLGNANAANTTVTLTDAGGATVQANFSGLELIATGSQFDIGNDEVGLAPAQFAAKPKVTTVYTDPVTRMAGKKASAKVVTKVSAKLPVDDITCDWTKKIRLFNAKLLAARHKANENTAAWLAANPLQNQPLDLPLTLTSKQVANGIPQAVRTVNLTPPEIGAVTVQVATIEVTGHWFGTKKPKVWMEYPVAGKGIKKLNCKLMAPVDYFDAKGKGIFMNQISGESKIVILRPTKLPAGVANWDAVTHVVIDNGCGIAAEEIDWTP